MIENWTGKRVTVMGLGRFGGGVGVTRWLAEQGARVLLTDKASEEQLAESLAQVRDLPLELRIGEHREADFRDADLVVVSPAVPDANPFIRSACDAGVPITTEINLFVERCPAQTVGVTGSVGKSTTTAMIGHILEHTPGAPRVWVGGNLGRSLLEDLPTMSADDVVVLELSSFQLHRTPLVRWSPDVAVITNLSPNHLDWHGDYEAYAEAKANILRFQQGKTAAFVVLDNASLVEQFAPVAAKASEDVPVWRFGLRGGAPSAARADREVAGDTQHLHWPDLRLAIPGRHNRVNAAAALTVAHVLGLEAGATTNALGTFMGLEHRLQRVADREGITWFNDSKSTTPQAAITAMEAMESPFCIILGGYDKQIDLTPAAAHAASHARFAACIGQTGRGIAEQVAELGGSAAFFPDLASAVSACREHARPGDAVLLSPGCASWGMYVDYRARGEEFARLARGEQVE